MRLTYLHLAAGAPLPTSAPSRPFRAVVVSEQMAEPGWRQRVCEWLVDAGCLYLMAWGQDCVEWHDSVDWAVLEREDFGEVPDDRFVMTTWHDKEPLSQVFWFSDHCAFHDVDLVETVILHVSPASSEEALLGAYAEAQDSEE